MVSSKKYDRPLGSKTFLESAYEGATKRRGKIAPAIDFYGPFSSKQIATILPAVDAENEFLRCRKFHWIFAIRPGKVGKHTILPVRQRMPLYVLSSG